MMAILDFLLVWFKTGALAVGIVVAVALGVAAAGIPALLLWLGVKWIIERLNP